MIHVGAWTVRESSEIPRKRGTGTRRGLVGNSSNVVRWPSSRVESRGREGRPRRDRGYEEREKERGKEKERSREKRRKKGTRVSKRKRDEGRGHQGKKVKGHRQRRDERRRREKRREGSRGRPRGQPSTVSCLSFRFAAFVSQAARWMSALVSVGRFTSAVIVIQPPLEIRAAREEEEEKEVSWQTEISRSRVVTPASSPITPGSRPGRPRLRSKLLTRHQLNHAEAT